jgi:HlyD family secretion protein
MNAPIDPPPAVASTSSAAPPPHPIVRRRRRWRLPLTILLALGVIGGGAWLWMGRAAPVSYVTKAADRGAVTQTVDATGTVNPVLTVTVGSYVSGVISSVSCDFNDHVTKGQVCATIDDRSFKSAVAQAQADLDLSKAQLLKDQAGLAYAQITYDRNAQLAAKNAVTQDAVDQLKSALDAAKAQIAVDQATIEQKQAALGSANITLAYTKILSPVSGTVVSRNVTAGQTVASSLQTPILFLIAQDLTDMQVDVNVSESDIGAVKAGERVTFDVNAFPGREFTGTVTEVRQSPQSVQNVVTYDVIIGVKNNDLALKPGMTASARIVVAEATDALRVPSKALRYQPSSGGTRAKATGAGTRGHVYVLRDGRPALVNVQTGLDDGTYAAILSGTLAVGDAVIVGETTGASAAARTGASGLRFRP